MVWYEFVFLIIFIIGLFAFLFFVSLDQFKVNEQYRKTLKSIEESLSRIVISLDK